MLQPYRTTPFTECLTHGFGVAFVVSAGMLAWFTRGDE